jgi:hypothetical protein
MRSYLTLPRPIGIYPYFDKMQFWVGWPLNQRTIASLRRQCGKGGLFVADGPAPFAGGFCQRVELRQPSERALRWLAQHNDALINQVEVTLDLVFEYRGNVEEAWDFFHQHLVRRWHRKSQEIRVVRSAPRDDEPGACGTRYDAGRRVPNRLVLYADDHTRITGELNCLHVEWRLTGLKAVRAAGIESGQDLSEFDHRAFWRRRLVFYSVDRRRLGLQIRNRQMGARRRSSKTCRSSAHWMDGRAGEVYARSFDTVQELIDELKSLCRIDLALKRIPNDLLLPE